MRPAAALPTVEDDRGHRAFSSDEHSAEVGVGRDQHPLLCGSSGQDFFIGGPGQPICGRVHSVMSSRDKTIGQL